MTPGIKLTEVAEGRTVILAPDLNFYSKGTRVVDPAWAPVFYNPAMRVSRDLSVAILAAYAKSMGRERLRVCEPLSATGVRGLRYAVEIEAVKEVVLNDKNKLAYELEIQNIAFNRMDGKVRAFNRDARALLLEFAERGEKFDVVDIDPFGSPAPFIEAALLALKHGGLLMVSATDLAPLFGKSAGSCKRKYFADPLRTEFAKEVGARILAGFIVREAAKLGLAAKPIHTFLSRHALRLALVVRRSRCSARKAVEQIGGIVYCTNCTFRAFTSYPPRLFTCQNCGSQLTVGGPAWAGGLWSPEFSLKVLECYKERSYLSEDGLRLAELTALESDKPPLYSTTTNLSKVAKLPREPSLSRVAEVAALLGVEFSHTHFDPKGFRTTAQPYEIAALFT